MGRLQGSWTRGRAARRQLPAEQPPPAQQGGKIRARIGSGFRALQVRNYRLFWIGQLISLTGSWMQTTAQSWLVLLLTSSPFQIGLVTMLQFLPMLLLTLFGGIIADRLPKYRVVWATQLLALAVAACFGALVASGGIELWHVYILALLQGTINAVDNPVRQAFMAELVGQAHLVNAVALNSMAFNASRIVGPAAAGLVIAAAGIAPVLYLNALSFLAVIASLLLMDRSSIAARPPRAQARVWEQLLEGLRYVCQTPRVLATLMVVAAIGTFGYNFNVIMPLLAGFVLHTEARGFGALSSFLGLGSLLAALASAYAGKATFRRVLVGSACFSVLLGLLGLTPVFALSAALLAVMGFAGITFATSANTLIQLTVPDALRGRVMSLYILLFAGTTPLGGLLIGALSERWGVPTALVTCAALCLLGVLGATLYLRRADRTNPGKGSE